MNDFLTRLVDQTLNLVPVVRPLIAPAFSPASVPTADRSSEIAAEPALTEALPAAEVGSPVSFEATPLPPKTRSTPPRLVAPIGEASPTEPEHPAQRVSASRPVSHLLGAEEPSAPLTPPPPVEPVKRPTIGASETHRSVSPREVIHRQRAGSTGNLQSVAPVVPVPSLEVSAASDSNRGLLPPAILPAVVAPQQVHRVVERPQRTPEGGFETTERVAEVLPPKLVKPLPPPTLASPSELESPAIASPHGVRVREQPLSIRPVTPTLPTSALRTEATSSAPTIRISIGRIEVRAVTAPAPAPTRTTSAPAARLSLDEYLRSHAGGKL